MPNEKRWYISADGADPIGPVSLDQLVRGAQAGKIPPDAVVCPEGGSAWMPLHELPEFRSAAAPPAPTTTHSDDRAWYVRAPGVPEIGPFTTAKLLRSIQANGIPHNAEVKEEGARTWLPVTNVPELNAAMPKSAAVRPAGPASGAGIKALVGTGGRRLAIMGISALMLVIVVTMAAFGLRWILKGGGESASGPSLPPAPHLPHPFEAVRIGMPLAELQKLYPATEKTSECKLSLTEGPVDRYRKPPAVPGADQQPTSRCTSFLDAAGFTGDEATKGMEIYEKMGDHAGTAMQQIAGQLRATMRAGLLADKLVYQAAEGDADSLVASVLPVAADFYDGGIKFLRDPTGRRVLCATLDESCDDFDDKRVRRFVLGGFSLGQLDADAHTRVVYGKCRGKFLAKETKLRPWFLSYAGVLTGPGIQRTVSGNKPMDAADSKTFSTLSSRTGLHRGAAAVAVIVANAMESTEAFWSGAITIVPPKSKTEHWDEAIIWIVDGRVARALINVREPGSADGMQQLSNTYGAPGSKVDAVTVWTLNDGVEARLDLGGCASLVVERAASRRVAPVVRAQPNVDAGVPATPSASATPAPGSAPDHPISVDDLPPVAPEAPAVRSPAARTPASSAPTPVEQNSGGRPQAPAPSSDPESWL